VNFSCIIFICKYYKSFLTSYNHHCFVYFVWFHDNHYINIIFLFHYYVYFFIIIILFYFFKYFFPFSFSFFSVSSFIFLCIFIIFRFQFNSFIIFISLILIDTYSLINCSFYFQSIVDLYIILFVLFLLFVFLPSNYSSLSN